jgi:hypothetical protein
MSEPRGGAVAACGGLCDYVDDPAATRSPRGGTVCGAPIRWVGAAPSMIATIGLNACRWAVCQAVLPINRGGRQGGRSARPVRARWRPIGAGHAPPPPEDPVTWSVVELKRFG